MKKIKTVWALSMLLILWSPVLAQRTQRAGEEAGACASCGLCGGSLFVMVLVPIAIFALNIALLVWVARDAKARGMDSAVIWMVLVMFTSVIGLIIYILSRPQGNVIRCPSCGNNRLQASAKCPHCGNA
jgi:hypothetical protein